MVKTGGAKQTIENRRGDMNSKPEGSEVFKHVAQPVPPNRSGER